MLLRHGRHADLGRRLTGRAPDNGLTPQGRGEALAAAALLGSDPPLAIYASPRRRTQETARLVAERFGLAVQTADALDEIDFGEWTGRDFAELETDPRWAHWNARRSTASCPGGESQSAAQARALAFAFEAASRHHGGVLLVTHCDIVRALICWAERRSLDDIHAVSCKPGSLHRLALGGQVRVAA